MPDLESKVSEAKEFLAQLDKVLVKEDGETARNLVINYITKNVREAGYLSDLPDIGSILLEAYHALNSSKQKVTLVTIDTIFNNCVEALSEVKFPADINVEHVISKTKQNYNEKKAYIIWGEAYADLDKGQVLSAIKKFNDACALSGTNDAQKTNLKNSAITDLKNNEVKKFIEQYALAGESALSLLETLCTYKMLGEFVKQYRSAAIETVALLEKLDGSYRGKGLDTFIEMVDLEAKNSPTDAIKNKEDKFDKYTNISKHAYKLCENLKNCLYREASK
jgi:hypothetical protein